jgi:hypothetical protein
LSVAYLDEITAARDSLAAVIKGELARQAALVAAGNPPAVTYSAGGRSMDWNGWLKDAMDTLKTMNEAVVSAGGAWEYVTRGYSA